MWQATDAIRRRRRLAPPLPLLLLVLELARVSLAFCPTQTLALSRCRGDGVAGGHATRRASSDRLKMMATSIVPPARTKAEKKDEFFQSNDRMIEFGSTQYVEASIAGASLASMQQYLSDPARIVYACWEHDHIARLEDDIFRLKFSGQSFLSVSIDMSVDIELKPTGNGKIMCKSVGYSVEDMAKILGQEFVDSFFLELEGELRVEETETKVRALTLKNTLLNGDVGVTVGGKMPALLAATPAQLVKSAALGINQRVLEYVSSTFVATIAGDYRQWAREKKQ